MTPPHRRRPRRVAESMQRHPSGQLAKVYALHPQDTEPWHHQPLRVLEPVGSRLMVVSERVVRRVAPIAAAVLLVSSGVALGHHDRRVDVQVVDRAAHVYNLTSPPQEPRYFGPAPG